MHESIIRSRNYSNRNDDFHGRNHDFLNIGIVISLIRTGDVITSGIFIRQDFGTDKLFLKS